MPEIHAPLNYEDVLPIGKYRGEMVGAICNDDPSYIFWMINNTDVKFVSEVVEYVESELAL